MMSKRGQEEIVGFAVIVVIVGVILLVLLGFMISNNNKNQKDNVQSYEVESFLGSALQFSSSCENELEFLSVQKLVDACESGASCLDGKDSCEVLNETLQGLVESAWNTENGSAIKGYALKVSSNQEDQLILQKGNETGDYRGGFQDFASGMNNYEVSLNVYY